VGSCASNLRFVLGRAQGVTWKGSDSEPGPKQAKDVNEAFVRLAGMPLCFCRGAEVPGRRLRVTVKAKPMDRRNQRSEAEVHTPPASQRSLRGPPHVEAPYWSAEKQF
jgi:hypothetical protein